MEEADRTAIHEVMEQQTVSIAKAGITTTLNARTAVLAAANPKYGRYYANADADPQQALLKNINLPAALLSRFDLMFVLRDEVSVELDQQLANHIAYVHQYEKQPATTKIGMELKDPTWIRQFVTLSKNIEPVVMPGLVAEIAEAYVTMRTKDRADAAKTGRRGMLTARQLLSILRLAQALARLNFRPIVNRDDVNEAIRLIQSSTRTVKEPVGSTGPLGGDSTSGVYNLLKSLFDEGEEYLRKDKALLACLKEGFTAEQFEQTVVTYVNRECVWGCGVCGWVLVAAAGACLTLVHPPPLPPAVNVLTENAARTIIMRV